MDLATIARRIAALDSHHSRPAPRGGGEEPAGAAVAAILRARTPEPEILLIERAEREGDPWSGHMALPGGHREPGDPTLAFTAIRETHEEVGVDLRTHDLLGALADVPTHRTGLVVRPFVFALRGEIDLRPAGEVAGVVWAPLGPLLRGELASTFDFQPEGFDSPITLPSFRLPGETGGRERIVWGLTYRILELLLAAVRE